MSRRDLGFQSIRSEGGLLPSDILRRVIDPRANLSGTKPEDYGLPVSERLNEVITQSWNRLRRHWEEFQTAAAQLPEAEAGTGVTNDKWSLPLLRELGFGLLPTSAGPELGGRSYAISRFFGPVPIHLIGRGLSLDRRAAGQRGAARGNPHGLVQEFLNRSPDHLWGIVSNGLRLRILRDNQALSRQSFIEFDLEAMFDGEIYADFVLLWLVGHATRFAPRGGSRAETCWLELWTKAAEEIGTRALSDLRGGVERALQVLGEGFTDHRQNTALREALRSGSLSPTDFHGQLLRVVYRLIFLFVAEDRKLEGTPLLHPPDDTAAGRIARERYAAHYSTARLREMAGSIKGSRHGDLWRQFQVLFSALSGGGGGEPIRQHLALPELGSFLWDPTSTNSLNDAELTNFDLLEALRHLAFTHQDKVLRPVDYKNLGAEELGGVYESLLALTPQISADGARFTFAEFAGNERKTSGSYYTPDSLVQCLLDTALDPVVEDAIRGKSGADAEKALLALKICDPAVGSGHFLVGAAHRLARYLAQVRALAENESEPSPLRHQQALRDVIGRCLYGVDVNPMAAELCRVGLWLEALEPGKPLSFLDHHIRVGNSLLGATPELITNGIPDEAFTVIEGDDKKACAVLKKRNKVERKGLGPLFAQQDAEMQARLQQAAAAFGELPDDQPEDIRAKELAFRRLEETEDYLQKKKLADAWCAAFVIRKNFREAGREASARGITQAHLNDLASGQALTDNLSAEVEHLSGQFQFFHWHLAFPEVSARGGFDCILGNPPWEMLQFQEADFFVNRPEVAQQRTRAARQRAIDKLRETDPAAHDNYLRLLRQKTGERHFMINSGRYSLGAVGRVNLYKLMLDHAWTQIAKSGRVGMVVPSGIAFDDFSKEFFQEMVQTERLVALFDFENRAGLFADVHRSMRFCLLTLAGQRQIGVAAELAFYLISAEELRIEGRRTRLSSTDIELLNPNTRTCPVFRTRRDAELCKAIYRRWPILVSESGNKASRVWNVQFGRIFNLGHEGDRFRDRASVNENENVWLPLYEGKMFDSFNHRAGSVVYRPQNHTRPYQAEGATLAQLEDPNFAVWSQFYLAQDECASRLSPLWAESWLIGAKDVTCATNERTLIACLLPLIPTSLSVRILLGKLMSAGEGAFLLALFNAFPVDWVVRQFLGGLHLQDNITKQLPVLPPKLARSQCSWLRELSLVTWTLPRVLELTFSAWNLEVFAKDCGWSGPPFRWDEERRFLLRCELDAAFFHLYLPATPDGRWKRAVVAEGAAHDESPEELDRLTGNFQAPRDAVAHIMDTFSIVRRKDEGKYDGDYRTKRVILEIYDEMQESIRTGAPYQTRLDPPPGPPIDADGKFVKYSEIAANPPSHIHLPRDHANSDLELQLSDLTSRFPGTPFTIKLGVQAKAPRIRVTPVKTSRLKTGENVVLATSALQLHSQPIPAAIGKLGIEYRSDASSSERYVLVSVRGDEGMAQARFSEIEWQTFKNVGRIEELD